MSFYIPSTVLPEHEAYRQQNAEYDTICKEIEESVDHIDPATLSQDHIEQTAIRWNNTMSGIINNMPNSNLKKLLRMFLAGEEKDHDYLRAILNDTNESNLIRMYSASILLGGNDFSKEEDIKARKPWTIHEDELAQISDKFLQIYQNSSEDDKNDDYVSEMYQTCYCVKKRHEWYPLGNKEILDDMYNFLVNDSEKRADDLLKMRIDKEYAILASFYYWKDEKEKAIEVCDRVIDRKKYDYYYNPFRLQCRCLKAQILIDKKDIVEAAKLLKRNINDYDHMKQKGNFKAMHAGSYYENDLFLVQMLKTYEMLEALVDRKYTAEKELLVKMKKGSTLEEKIKDLDLHNNRHQWEEYVKLTNERTNHIGKIRSEQLLSV